MFKYLAPPNKRSDLQTQSNTFSIDDKKKGVSKLLPKEFPATGRDSLSKRSSVDQFNLNKLDIHTTYIDEIDDLVNQPEETPDRK